MTVTIQSTNIIGAIQFTFAAAGDSYVILPGVTVGSQTAAAINFNGLADLTLDVGGSLVSKLQMTAFGIATNVSIGIGGRLTSLEPSSLSAALYFANTLSRLDNAGEFIAERTIAVLSAGGNDVVNSGRIVGASGVFLGSLGGAGDTLVNSGEITATQYADASNGILENNGVVTQGANTRITNLAGGVINASGTQGAGVRLDSGADGSWVYNDGAINAVVWYGVDFSGMGALESGRLNNSGTVRGFQGSFNGNDSTDFVTNRGTMVGHVQLNDGNDVFDGRGGRIEGELFAGNGSDRLDLRGATLVSGQVWGGTGNDTIRGSDNADSINGETDGDQIDGGGGNDLIFGSTGNDVIQGGDGDDTIDGGADNDDLNGGAGDDVLTGADGQATIRGGDGNDLISITVDLFLTANLALGDGGAGDDTISGGLAADTIRGGSGDDVISADAGSDLVSGGADNDQISLSDGLDTGNGGTGDDTILGEAGNDVLDGGAGADSLDGGADNDGIAGGFGEDILIGGTGNDTLDGGNQDDNLTGGTGNDILRGGRGADVLAGETGRDTLVGGAGGDSFVFLSVTHSAVGVNADVIDDFTRGQDVIDISALAAAPILFQGAGAFAGGGAASVRFDVVGNVTTVRIDANGDAVSDSEVILNGVSTLAATDFLL